jgi:predicted lipid-binding transport protein (Tim44 family)
MNFTLTITISPELMEAVKILAGSLKAQPIVAAAPSEPTPAVTTTRTRKTQPAAVETKPEETVTKTEETVTKVEETVTKTEETTEVVTVEKVRAAVQEKAQSGKRDQVKQLLTKFDVARVTDLPEAKYSKFLEEVNAL